jgi:hypothetical protein
MDSLDLHASNFGAVSREHNSSTATTLLNETQAATAIRRSLGNSGHREISLYDLTVVDICGSGTFSVRHD